MDKKEIALKRAKELKKLKESYLKAKSTIDFGMDEKIRLQYQKSKKKLMSHYGIDEDMWCDYNWQMTHRIKDVDILDLIIDLSEQEKEEIIDLSSKLRWTVTPYYACLIDPKNKLDPIKLNAIPSFLEKNDAGEADPMDEALSNPAGSITRRYPDRLIINVTNVCPSYCRHCQRRRLFGEFDKNTPIDQINESIKYIKQNKEIRDVLITGGEPLTLMDDMLEYILKALREISHVEIIRIGTRALVNLPFRITDELVDILKRYYPIYINTHFNHPKEITPEVKKACLKLADNGIILGNQTVLLNGINNDKYIMEFLNEKLLTIKVRPYYLFHSKNIKGTSHFNTSFKDGIEIMKYLRGRTSGLAIPTYIVNAPHGLGKMPIPAALKKVEGNYYYFENWEGKEIKYLDNPTIDFKKLYEERKKL